MGFLKDVAGGIAGFTGFGGQGRKEVEQGTQIDPTAWSQLYEQALGDLQGVGNSPEDQAIMAALKKGYQGQLQGFDNNQAGRKAQFNEDYSRGFQADVQNLARSRGQLGGTVANIGQMYDANARNRARGLTGLYSQGIQDLQGINQGYGQTRELDSDRARAIAGLRMQELGSRRAGAAGNASMNFNTNNELYNRRSGTVGGLLRAGTAAASSGGGKPPGGP